MKTTAEKIAVMQAFEEGKWVQYSLTNGSTGFTKKEESSELPWNWESCDYEIVQEEPKPVQPAKAREWWLHLAGTDVVLYGQLSCGHPSDVLVREVLPGADDQKAAEIGRKWVSDSSLETWFPFTAKELNNLRAERERLVARLKEAQELFDSARAEADRLATELAIAREAEFIMRNTRDHFYDSSKRSEEKLIAVRRILDGEE